MSVKFGRTYTVSIAARPVPLPPGYAGEIEFGTMLNVSYPLTMKFDVSHNLFSDANDMHLQLYNLSPLHQKQIYWDPYLTSTPVPVTLFAGYGNSVPLPQIFTGYVKLAYTERIGSNTITHIEAYDGGFGIATGTISYTAKPNTPYVDMFNTLVNGGPGIGSGLPGVTAGLYQVTTPPPLLSDGFSFAGNTWEQMQLLVPEGGNKCIVNGVASIIGFGEQLPVSNSLGILSTSSGLLGVPRRMGYRVDCSCIFEPRMQIGQTLQLQSTFNSWVNGPYQIAGFKHSGTISAVESGDCTTDISLFSIDPADSALPASMLP